MITKHVYFIYFVLVASLVSGSIVPSDTFYKIKYTEFQGLQIKTAVFTAEFDEELSVLQTIPCAHYPCNTTQLSNICDYTNTRGACGTTLDSQSTCPDSSTICNSSLNSWQDILEGQSISSSVQPGEWKHFRFLMNRTCSSFGIKVTASSGNPFVFLNTDPLVALTDPQSNPVQSITDANRPLYFTMCPYHPDFIVGTYFISVIGVISQSNFSIILQAEDINDTSTTTNSCSSSTHECLYPDEPYNGVCSEVGLQYFKFEYTPQITSCEIFSFGIRAFGDFREVDLYASRIYEYPYFGNQSEWSSYNVFDDWITTSICMTAGNTTTIYLTVECWGDNNTFILSASTKPSQLGKPLNQLDAYSGVWELPGSAFFVYDTTGDIYSADNYLRCDEWRYTCTNFWFGFSNNRTSPFWPMPPVLSSFSSMFRSIHQLLTYDGDTSDLGSQVSMIVVLSITPNDGATQIYLDESYLETSGFVFSNKLVNSNLEPVEGTYTFSKREISCSFPDFQEFNQLNEQLIDLMGTTYDSTSLNVLQYELGITEFYDEWYGCLELLNSLLEYTQDAMLVNTTACFKTLDDPSYYEDPCCYPLPSWQGVCYPTAQNLTTDLPQSYDSAVVKSTCRNPKCSESFLEDYANYQNYQIMLSTSYLQKDKNTEKEADLGCDTGLEAESDTIINSAISTYRACKDAIYSSTAEACYQDSDCIRDNTTFSCDAMTHTCQIPRSFQDLTFVECLVSVMNSYQKQYIGELYNISTSDANFTLKYYEALLEYDCMDSTGPVTSIGSHYYLQMYDQSCATTYSCPSLDCMDESCEIEENACVTWCEEKGWSYVAVSEDECLSEVFCNWNSTMCDGEDYSTCQNWCTVSQSAFFCGLCEGDQCIEFGLDETDCQTTPVCILPDGSYVLNTTEAECLNFQNCNGNCEPQCVSSLYAENGICYNSQINSTDCVVMGGTYNDTTCIYYNESRDNCSILGTWASCLDLSLSDCFDCSQEATGQNCVDANFSFLQSLLQCRIDSHTACSNQTQCENSGECSVNSLLWDGTGDTQYGACLIPRLEPVDTYYGLFLYPFCDSSLGLVDVPNGCLDYSQSKTDCLANGYVWEEPKFTESDCTSQEGCLDVFDELYTVGLQYAFSPKTQSDCLSEYNEGGQWDSYYNWNSAKWTSGVQRNLTWVQRQAKYSHNWSKVVSFSAAQNSFINGATSQVAIETKSSVLCQNSKLQQTLVAISCDCGENGGKHCFTENVAIAAGQAKICAGSSSSITTAIASISIFENSVSQSCSDMFLSEISMEEFRQTVQPTLSAGFASFKKPNSFAIYNSKDSEIGSLLGDGIEIEFSDSVTLYELCLSITQDISKDYKVWDLASADAKYDTLTPVGLSISQESAEKAKSEKVLCVNLTVDSASTVNYFPIIRLDNWETADVPLLDDTSLGLVYTLAALFLVVALFCIVKLIWDVYSMTTHNRRPDLAFFVILFIFMFNLIRSIHFFLLPTGVDNTVVDFFLVVLPTFFYFSAFSLVIVVWGVVCSNALTRSFGQSVKYIARFSVIVNVMLYLLLVAIVTAFAVANSANDDSPCNGRVSTGSDDSVLKSLSIAYSVIIAVISFAVGIAFLIFGGRLYAQITKSGRKANQRKIILVTIACSVGFMLHCVFILVASLLDEPIVVFSFLGLIITEIVPSLFLLSMFNQFRKKDETSSNNAGSTRQTRSIRSAVSHDSNKEVEMN